MIGRDIPQEMQVVKLQPSEMDSEVLYEQDKQIQSPKSSNSNILDLALRNQSRNRSTFIQEESCFTSGSQNIDNTSDEIAHSPIHRNVKTTESPKPDQSSECQSSFTNWKEPRNVTLVDSSGKRATFQQYRNATHPRQSSMHSPKFFASMDIPTNLPLQMTLQKELLYFLNHLDFLTLQSVMQAHKIHSSETMNDTNTKNTDENTSSNRKDTQKVDVKTDLRTDLKEGLMEGLKEGLKTDQKSEKPTTTMPNDIQLLDKPCNSHSRTNLEEELNSSSPLEKRDTSNTKIEDNSISHPLLTSEFNFHLSSYVSIVQSFIDYLNNNYGAMIQFVTEDRTFDLGELWKGNILQEMWQKIGILRMNADRVILSLSASYYIEYNEYLDIYQDIYQDLYIEPIVNRGTESRRKRFTLYTPSIQITKQSNVETHPGEQYLQHYSPLTSIDNRATVLTTLKEITPHLKRTNLAKLANRAMIPNSDEPEVHKTRKSPSISLYSSIFTLLRYIRSLSLHCQWKHRLEKLLMILSTSFWVTFAIRYAFHDLKVASYRPRPMYRFLCNILQLNWSMKDYFSITKRNILFELRLLRKALFSLFWRGALSSLISIGMIKLLMSSIYINQFFHGDVNLQNINKLCQQDVDIIFTEEILKQQFEGTLKRKEQQYSFTPTRPITPKQLLLPSPATASTSPNNNRSNISNSLTKTNSSGLAANTQLNTSRLSQIHPLMSLSESSLSVDSETKQETKYSPQDIIRREAYLKVMIQLKKHIQLMDRLEYILQQLNERILFYDAALPSGTNAFVVNEAERDLFEEKTKNRFTLIMSEIQQFSDFLKAFPIVPSRIVRI